MHAFRLDSRILLRFGETLVPFPIEDVVRFEAVDGGVVAVLTPDAEYRRASVRSTLNELEERLGSGFLRVQRAELLNLDWVLRFEALGDGRVEAVLRDGGRVIASRSVSIELRRAAL